MEQNQPNKQQLNNKLKLRMFLTILTYVILFELIHYFAIDFLIKEALITYKGEILIAKGIAFLISLFTALILFSRNLISYYYKTLNKWLMGLILVIYGLPLLFINTRDAAYIILLYIFLLYFTIYFFSGKKIRINLKDSFKITRTNVITKEFQDRDGNDSHK